MTKANKKSDLPLRIITALILVCGLFALIEYGTRFIVLGVLLLIGFLASFELLRMNPKFKKTAIMGGVFTVFLILCLKYVIIGFESLTTNLVIEKTLVTQDILLMIFVLMAIVFLASLSLLASNSTTDLKEKFNNALFFVFSCFYIAIPLFFIMNLFYVAYESFFIFLAIACTALGDTFAYFGGKAFGKHKLAPVISPNKTLEGAVFALIGGALTSVLFYNVFYPETDLMPQNVSLFVQIAIGILLALVGILGDLSESAIKRVFQVKDSGTILPGHGGILDRIDAYLLTLPVMYFCIEWNLVW